ncbi:rhomboid family intramembrane serine protease [Pseudomonas daroniae]|uniref:Rhomboid family intramembrane serine protease n=1 Tax=Phytopseudomonas daroniae TaxID=2487519 RepID=A0A4Q9QPE9_9GAMM|nr:MULTISPECIES: rhomboid family intramembrane serine protease [Pseudomonas]TBU82098.1 rhomboid family intramembrane serine protease [Pseudomonas daroniae]TBU84566.1 rhomboid family intramembrane serine protease [Pseudomonas sp. FRB 228]TBU92399.1 rhomboid family intramembrane serine protease [Pseudomonas daroniae]
MSAVIALRVPLDEDLAPFIALLRNLGVAHRVAEQANEQVLWVPDEQVAGQVRELYVRVPQGDPNLRPMRAQAARERPGFLSQAKRSPLTLIVLALTLLVALLTWGGENYDTVRWLSFVDFHIDGQYIYFGSFAQVVDSGQWWRVLTPMLLHFGLLHLAMNSLWYWELGRRIEARQGALMLLLLTLWFGLAANVAQYVYGGPALFGGLSGVLYGLLGHCWLFQWLAPNTAYRLPRGVLVSMLIWLLICMTGVFELLQFGAIANAAHVGGLVAGCVTGAIGGLLARRLQHS